MPLTRWLLGAEVFVVVPSLISRLMLGFMSGCAFLSLWVQNTLAVTMVMPIVEAVLQQIVKDEDGGCVGKDNPNLQLEGDRFVLLEHVQKVYFPQIRKGNHFHIFSLCALQINSVYM